MTPLQQRAADNAARYTREDAQRRKGMVIAPQPKPEGNSPRYDKYLILMASMRERAALNQVSKRDLRTIAQGNAGDKLRAGRMMLAYLGG